MASSRRIVSSSTPRTCSRVSGVAVRSASWQSAQSSSVGGEFGERLVLDDQLTGLFEVRLGDPPAAHEVAVEAVGEHLAEHAVGVGTCRSLEFLLAGVRVERQVQRLEHLLRNLVVGEALLARVGDGAPQRGAQQGDLHEVVEVAGLE